MSSRRLSLTSTPASIGRGQGNMATPRDQFISPSSRRHVSITSPAPVLAVAANNNDRSERHERRRSQVLEINMRTLSSPVTPSRSVSKTSEPLSTMSDTQLSEHYNSCIKLSTENKINSKNAFGLHLIDYMTQLLKKKEMNNFQLASSTLDASAKIYASRVDAIHSETYKVLTGLGRGADRSQKDDQDGNEAGDQDSEEGPGKKRKKTRKHNTIEANVKKLNVNQFNLEFEVDPLFKKTSATFDEGGTKGLLLNHLRCLNDNSELVLDSNTIVTGYEEEDRATDPQSSKLVPMTELQRIYAGLNLEGLQICPAFASFEFVNWRKDGEDTFSNTMMDRMAAGDQQHAFDLDAEPEPIPECTVDNPGGDMDGADFDMGFGDDDNDGDDGSNQSDHGIMLGDGKEAKIAETAVKNIQHGTIGELIQVLAAEPSEYSYFSKNLMNMWAGPAHWKFKPKSKEAQQTTDGNDTKKPKKKKVVFRITYSEQVDFDSFFKKKRAATTLSKATLDKYSKDEKILPEDLDYDADKLFRNFLKPKVMVKRQKTGAEDMDGDVDNYDYDNEADKENFCPAMDGDDDDHDDMGGFNFTAGGSEFNQTADMFSSQGSMVNHENPLDGTLAGDNLVAQPRKVAKIDIAYAKTAKRMDVRRLKVSMWSILTSAGTEKENKVDNQQILTDTAIEGQHSFQTMVQELPSKLSTTMSNNLSVPIAFVCLLHLANEKTLQISGQSDMGDFVITQG